MQGAFVVCFASLHWPTRLTLCVFDPVAYVLLAFSLDSLSLSQFPIAYCPLCTAACCLLLFLRLLFLQLQLPHSGKYLHTRTHSGCLGHTMPSLSLPLSFTLPFYASPVSRMPRALPNPNPNPTQTDLLSHISI